MKGKRKILIFSILGLIIISLISIAAYYWYNNTYYVSTEDAKVDADLVRVGPQITAKLTEFNVEDGDSVVKDQILGRQEALPGVTLEKSIIRATISGLVIKKQGTVGEIVTPGQTLAVLIDPSKIYITANIKETKLNKVKVGQQVDITIDQYPDATFTGRVKHIGLAANSTFSLLPNSTGGTFTKTVQRIPIKIGFDPQDHKLLPGTNAVIKIHIK